MESIFNFNNLNKPDVDLSDLIEFYNLNKKHLESFYGSNIQIIIDIKDAIDSDNLIKVKDDIYKTDSDSEEYYSDCMDSYHSGSTLNSEHEELNVDEILKSSKIDVMSESDEESSISISSNSSSETSIDINKELCDKSSPASEISLSPSSSKESLNSSLSLISDEFKFDRKIVSMDLIITESKSNHQYIKIAQELILKKILNQCASIKIEINLSKENMENSKSIESCYFFSQLFNKLDFIDIKIDNMIKSEKNYLNKKLNEFKNGLNDSIIDKIINSLNTVDTNLKTKYSSFVKNPKYIIEFYNPKSIEFINSELKLHFDFIQKSLVDKTKLLINRNQLGDKSKEISEIKSIFDEDKIDEYIRNECEILKSTVRSKINLYSACLFDKIDQNQLINLNDLNEFELCLNTSEMFDSVIEILESKLMHALTNLLSDLMMKIISIESKIILQIIQSNFEYIKTFLLNLKMMVAYKNFSNQNKLEQILDELNQKLNYTIQMIKSNFQNNSQLINYLNDLL